MRRGLFTKLNLCNDNHYEVLKTMLPSRWITASDKPKTVKTTSCTRKKSAYSVLT